jgi:hypothetical protein
MDVIVVIVEMLLKVQKTGVKGFDETQAVRFS